jgi:hypothetical protein
MKTFIALTVALFAFGFSTANALTTEQAAALKANAIKAVTDAIATGDQDKTAAAVSEQVGKYPEWAGDIVLAGIKATGNPNLQNTVVFFASFIAYNEIGSIKAAIYNSGLNGKWRLLRVAKFGSSLRLHILTKDRKFTPTPPGGPPGAS